MLFNIPQFICVYSVHELMLIYFSVWGVAAFLGSALGPMIGGPLLYLFGHRQEKGYSIEGYTVLFGLSSTYFLISAVSIRWVKNPSV